MATSEILSMSGSGPTPSARVDLSRFRNGCGLICTVDAGATAFYTVQVSGDNSHWNDHDVLVNKTTSANDSLAYPVNYVRLNGTSSNGSVTLVVVQGQ